MKFLILLLASLLFMVALTAISYAQMPNTVDGYLHLTMVETAFWDATEPVDTMWFSAHDTLYGAVRSNDFLAIQLNPVFFDHVYSSQSEFQGFWEDAYFEHEPVFNVPEFEFPFDLEEIAQIAEEQDHYFDNTNNWQTQIEANANGWHIVRWPLGIPLLPETIEWEFDIAYDVNQVFFVEDPLQIKGNSVSGTTTIVCDNQIRIIDNLKYSEVSFGNPTYIPENTTSVLGLIAVNDILIANTVENGRENGLYDGPLNDHFRKHCIVTASLVSLEGSISFENKNFPEGMTRHDGYVFQNGTVADHRGTLYIIGSMAQYRRDYFYTRNNGFTGYTKHFRYDQRLEELTPPLFDTPLSVGDGPRSSATLPITHRVEKVYPNPFNSSFNLNMTLIKRDQVRIRLINVLGQEIYNQNYGWMDKGDQRFVIDIAEKPAGLYFTEISTSSGFRQTSKVVYMK